MTAGTTLSLTLELAPRLLAAASSSVGPRIEAELSDLLSELGVARLPEVRLEAATPTTPLTAMPPIRLFGDGRLWHLADGAVADALAYVQGTPLVASVVDADTVLDHLESDSDPSASERLDELLALVCRQALSDRAGVLLPSSPLQPALDLGMSLAGHDIDALSAAVDDESPEWLLDRLGASTVDLLIEPGYAREVTTQTGAAEYFQHARDGLFTELGLTLPPFRLCLDPSLKSAGFAFRVQGARTLPRVGLAQDTVLVNDTAQRLALMNIEAHATVNPENCLPAAVVARDHKEQLETAGFTTWDPLGYIVLTFATVLRRNAHALVTTSVTARQVDQLGKAYPALKEQVDAQVPLGVVTSVLRELIGDGISIQNLRQVLELLLRYETDEEASRGMDRVTFVRSGLADPISFKASRGTGTIVVYLLAPELEDAVAAASSGRDSAAPEDAQERLCKALAAEMAHLPPTAQVPVVLTQDEVRRSVRDALRGRFPRITVLSYADLGPRYNIQPIARIS